MQLLDAVDEAHVVAAFLRAELDSERFGDDLRASLQEQGADEAARHGGRPRRPGCE
jgi:hypothetical protein